MNTKRERKLWKFNSFTRRLNNLLENKKDAGMSVNKYRASNVEAKKIT